jgi:DNA-directed RNA polymerase subunit H
MGENLASDNIFNVLKHDLVPEHRLLSLEEEKAILEEKGITKDKLPKIRKNDPGIKALENTAEAKAILGS